MFMERNANRGDDDNYYLNTYYVSGIIRALYTF